jgi:hypothetical protein
MRLSLTFAIIAGIMALDNLEVSVNRGPLLRRSTVAPVMSKPAMPGMMPSASLQSATEPLEKLAHAQLAWHKPIARTSSLKAKGWSNFAVLYGDVCDRF